MPPQPITIFWFRRDLRLDDNVGLYQALSTGVPVLPLFIFDRNILDDLSDKHDRRVAFIHQTLQRLDASLGRRGSGLLVRYGRPLAIWEELLGSLTIGQVHTNRDYEPYAIERDQAVAALLASRGIPMHLHKDQVIFDGKEVAKDDGSPYTVYTPYKNRWLSRLRPEDLAPSASEELLDRLLPLEHWPAGITGGGTPADMFPDAAAGMGAMAAAGQPTAAGESGSGQAAAGSRLPRLADIGFESVAVECAPVVDEEIIRRYDRTRDLPAVAGTTRLSVHLRFGTVSVRQLVQRGRALNQTWLQELIWREFFMSILARFPHVVDRPFKSAYAAIPWRENRQDFQRWCDGETGYPIVDAGMRELNSTGFMHNRVRMITASFLAKHLLLPWLWGERYFAVKLLDYDLSANNGNWQWAAGCGCDAAPYFRLFNPELQTAKFDPQMEYVKKWVPELNTLHYPRPMVPHAAARIRALETYSKALAAARSGQTG